MIRRSFLEPSYAGFMFSRSALLLPALGLALAAQTPPEVVSTARERTELGITIYHNNLAMIRDTRRVAFPAGRTTMAFTDVALSMRPKSAWMTFKNSSATVLERNFEFNLLSPTGLVDHSLAQPVGYFAEGQRDLIWGELASLPLRKSRWAPWRTPLQRIARTGPVLQAADTSVLVRRNDHHQTDVREAALVFRQIPSQLRPTPTLLADMQSQEASTTELELTYMTQGLSWEASYVASLDVTGKAMDLDAWVTLSNKCGTDLCNAKLQLVAGNPNQVWEPQTFFDDAIEDRTSVEVCASAIAKPIFTQERLADYQLFTLNRSTTLLNQQTKQIALFQANRIPVERFYLTAPPDRTFDEGESAYLQGRTFDPIPDPDQVTIRPSYVSRMGPIEEQGDLNLSREDADQLFAAIDREEGIAVSFPPVRVCVRAKNSIGSPLGRSLPKGDLRVLYRPNRGPEIWVSNSEIEETPVGSWFEFVAGNASGLQSHRCATKIHAVPSNNTLHTYEISFSVLVWNTRKESAEVLVREPVFAGWEILESTVPPSRVGTNACDFKLAVPTGGKAELHYRVRTNPTSIDLEPRLKE